MFIGAAHATEMCAKNNTIVVPLDATVSVTDNRLIGSNEVEWIWWDGFPYGKVYGVATCLSLQEVQKIENNPDLTAIPSVLNSDDDTLVGGVGNDANGNIRSYCFCKLTHPMSSNWVFGRNLGNGCGAYQCNRDCYDWMSYKVDFRTKFFNSIGASMAEKEPETDTE
jgi:hypothetical protein